MRLLLLLGAAALAQAQDERDDPALGLTLDALGRGADAATATMREVATAVARQASTIDAKIL